MNDHAPVIENWKLMDSTGELGSWILRLFDIQFNVARHAGAKNKETEALSRVKTTGSHYRPYIRVFYSIAVLCITRSSCEKKEAGMSSMQGFNVIGEKQSPRLQDGYALWTSTTLKQNKCQITTLNIFLEQAKDSYCRKVSFRIGLPGTVYMNRMHFWGELGRLAGQHDKLFLKYYDHVFRITCINQDLRNIQQKHGCDWIRKSSIGHTSRQTSIKLWVIAMSSLRAIQLIDADVTQNYSWLVTHWSLSQLTFSEHSWKC